MKKIIVFCLTLLIGSVYANEMPPIPVEAISPKVESIENTLNTIGTLRSSETAIIRPEISGRITAFHFNDGNSVKKGQLLVTLDDSLVVAEVSIAKAKYTQAELEYQRTQSLLKKGTGTQREHDMALANAKIAKASLELAEARLNQTQLIAPFSGMMGIKSISAGNYVNAGDALVSIENLDTLFVYFKAPERYLPQLKVGAPLVLKSNAYPGQTFDATIVAIDAKVDEKDRTLLVKGELNNQAHLLRAGMFVSITISLKQEDNALLIPETAIFADKEGKYVFQLKSGKAEKTKITTGKRIQGWVEVISGLTVTDKIIKSGHLRIHDGAAVSPVGLEQENK